MAVCTAFNFVVMLWYSLQQADAMRPLTIKPIIALAAAFLLAVEGYTIYYCVEKVRHAAGSATTVGDDVVAIGYVTTVASTIFSALAVFFCERCRFLR